MSVTKISISFLLFLVSLVFSTSNQAKDLQSANIIVGAEQPSKYLPLLKGKRVGLLVNQTSLVSKQHLVDFLIERGINVALIFAPEHGFRGEHGAGESVLDGRDVKTGVEIVSLHGKIKKPLASHLKKLDILIFDIQDVGVRFYTYISSMHYFMESCAENAIPLVILDRPNPNGDYIDGPVLEPKFASFVGKHPIPVVHGLTVAELAQMINGEGWLKDAKQCQLKIIKVNNYDHNRHYSLPVKPSPNLPNDLSVRLYPSLGFFEATPVSVGRGTDWPFQVLGFPNKKMGRFSFTPKSIRGSWKNLNHAKIELYGERFKKSPQAKLSLSHFVRWYQLFQSNQLEFINRPKFLDKLAGNSKLRSQLSSGMNAAAIEKSWQPGLRKYQQKRKQYLLYTDSDLIK